MATQGDARRIALSLPNVVEAEDGFAVSVMLKPKPKHFIWEWLERVHPKKARVPNPEVLVLRVRNEEEKAALLASDSEKFFTEPHYNGYHAVLLRLKTVRVKELRTLIKRAYDAAIPETM
ncbi:MAG TPA: MmcQ/YjbR family DNA-binding protein [Planctomycetota bacterium]|nr:MmcQ/YjbR family DNA-binding protein [Planctomycetota bacterium]